MDDKWFKAQQKRVGVTADEIAKEMGRTRTVVSHIYTGRQRMTIEWAKAFSKVLQVPLDEVLKHAGVLDEPQAQVLAPGFADGDATPFTARGGAAERADIIAQQLGGDRPGVDLWQVKSDAMRLDGYLPGDHILVDTHQSERAKPGDVVIAQKYNWQTGAAETVLRRFEPPVLTASNPATDDGHVTVVDGNNVVIKGKVIASWRG